MMWWDIIKESRQTSRVGPASLNWEEEMVPEKDETKCKDKLLALQQVLKDWKPHSSVYLGGSHRRGSNVSTNYLYQNTKPSSVTQDLKSPLKWLENEGEDFSRMIMQYDTHWIKDISEENACKFLEELKQFVNTPRDLTTENSSMASNFRPDISYDWAYWHAAYFDKGEMQDPHSSNEGNVKWFFNFRIGYNDKQYSGAAFLELTTLIKQQL